MKTKKNNLLKSALVVLSFAVLSVINIQSAYAHCDSFDGPALKDAAKALTTNNAELLKKWITAEQEAEVIALFHKTYSLRNGDAEVYKIVKTHFYETFVRLHREMENAPYTGLKPAGSTAPIITMSDNAIETGDVDGLLGALSNHVNSVLKEKFEKVAELNKVKDDSPEKGREFVRAYIDFTHSVEAVHAVTETGDAHKH